MSCKLTEILWKVALAHDRGCRHQIPETHTWGQVQPHVRLIMVTSSQSAPPTAATRLPCARSSHVTGTGSAHESSQGKMPTPHSKREQTGQHAKPGQWCAMAGQAAELQPAHNVAACTSAQHECSAGSSSLQHAQCAGISTCSTSPHALPLALNLRLRCFMPTWVACRTSCISFPGA